MLPRTFDPIFSTYGAGIPVNYLRSLAKRESNLRPDAVTGSYLGLLQVGKREVLPSFNARHGTNYSDVDLFTPEVNVQVAADHIRRAVDSLQRNHPRSPNLQEDWGNPEFVALTTAAWNSGHSEAAGVGRVAKYLEGRGVPVTHANVFRYADAAGGTQHLQNPTKERWQKSVVDLYFAEGGPGRLSMGLLLLALGGYAWWRLSSRS